MIWFKRWVSHKQRKEFIFFFYIWHSTLSPIFTNCWNHRFYPKRFYLFLLLLFSNNLSFSFESFHETPPPSFFSSFFSKCFKPGAWRIWKNLDLAFFRYLRTISLGWDERKRQKSNTNKDSDFSPKIISFYLCCSQLEKYEGVVNSAWFISFLHFPKLKVNTNILTFQ